MLEKPVLYELLV